MSHRQPRSIFIPCVGLGLLTLGGVIYARPEAAKSSALEIAQRSVTFAQGLCESAGWSEFAKTKPAPTTRGYRAPRRITATKDGLTEAPPKSFAEVAPASFDEPVQGESTTSPETDAQRPQVKSPLLAPPANSSKIRELGEGKAPLLAPHSPSREAAKPIPPKPAQARKVTNPHAMQISDEGQTPSQNENAVLESPAPQPGELKPVPKGGGNEPSAEPLTSTETEPPIGSGLQRPAPAAAPQERSVLRRKGGQEIPAPLPNRDTAPDAAPRISRVENPAVAPHAEVAAKPTEAPVRKPLTARLQDATPPDSSAEIPSPAELLNAPARNADSLASPAPAVPTLTAPGAAALGAREFDLSKLDHHPSNFRGLTPGTSDAAAVSAALGTPTSTANDGDSQILTFVSEPFQSVEVAMYAGKADSITLSLHKPLPAKEIIKELGLSPFEPGLVTTADGYVLGQVYPERGVVLHFTDDENGVPAVDKIVLDTVKAEPFLLRALEDKDHRYEQSLLDLEVALALDPAEPRALWLKAHMLSELGRHTSALTAIDDALRMDPTAVGYRLSRAKTLLGLGRHTEASRLVVSVLSQKDLPPEAKARALCQQGELLATGEDPDFDQSVKAFMAAIQEASSLAEDARPAPRRLARRILIESHLGVARAIAWGQMEDAIKATAQWNERAKLLAETAVSDEDVGDDIWLSYHRSVMSCHLGLTASSDPTKDISDLQQDYKRLLRSAGDAAFRGRVEWEFSLALTDASRVESARGKHRAATQHAEAAWELMSAGVVGREPSAEDDYARGMLLYQLGSIAAVAKENHPKAIEWYNQAIPLLEQPLPESLLSQKGLRGLSLVGMGASFWETGDQQRAIELSAQGAKVLEEAASVGRASRASLELAYGNLESMYRDLGDNPSADRVAKLSARLEKSTTVR